MITQFEHKFNIGDTVFLTFYSRGQYRVRKKTGYKIKIIRFNLSTPFPYAVQPEDKKEKSVSRGINFNNETGEYELSRQSFEELDDILSKWENMEND